MTVSTHVYTAELLGTPDVDLDVQGGSVTLDAGSAPHVSASLTIPRPPESVADALDVRTSPPPRVRITVVATFPSLTQSREFDLTVRTRPIRHGDGSMTLDLASDEALVQDYAPLADIDLRAITDLATLAEAVVLEATGETVTVGGATVDVTPLWDATNLILNPSLEVDAANWGAGAGASALTRVAAGSGAVGAWCLRWTAAAGDSDVFPHAGITQTRAVPGKLHTFGVRLQSPTPRNARVHMRFYDASSGLLAEYMSAYAMTVTGGWQHYVVQGQAPSQASFVFCYIHVTGNSAGQQHFADGAYLVSSEFDPGYFDGATPDTALYNYAWTGAAHASASTRTKLVEAPDPAALVWDAGQFGIEFLSPLVQASGLRLVCDETRSWTLRTEDYTAPGALNMRHAVNLVDADDIIDRTDDSWYDAAVTEYTWSDVYGVEQKVRDAFGLPGYSRLRRFEKSTAYPGPGFSEYAVRRAQGRGRTVTASSVSDWRAHAEQPITVHLEDAAIQTGKTDRVTFNLDNDEMTVSTRTTDTPPTAYIIGPVGVSYLDVPVGVDYLTFDWSVV